MMLGLLNVIPTCDSLAVQRSTKTDYQNAEDPLAALKLKHLSLRDSRQ